MWPFPPSESVLRDRVGELEAEVAMLRRELEMLGACNDRLRADLSQSTAANVAASMAVQSAELQTRQLMIAYYAVTHKAEMA